MSGEEKSFHRSSFIVSLPTVHYSLEGMGRVGLEPALELIQMVFETIASTGSATSPAQKLLAKKRHSSFPNRRQSTIRQPAKAARQQDLPVDLKTGLSRGRFLSL
jgi:hypothetical protein